MPVAITNASTLIHLSAIGQLQLLRRFHHGVVMPPAVWKEVVSAARGRTCAMRRPQPILRGPGSDWRR